VLHEGSRPSHGHYFAVVQHENQWYHCSDMQVDAVQEASALAPSATVYMCLYVREGKLPYKLRCGVVIPVIMSFHCHRVVLVSVCSLSDVFIHCSYASISYPCAVSVCLSHVSCDTMKVPSETSLVTTTRKWPTSCPRNLR